MAYLRGKRHRDHKKGAFGTVHVLVLVHDHRSVAGCLDAVDSNDLAGGSHLSVTSGQRGVSTWHDASS